MSPRKKKPFYGIPFGWERTRENGAMGFTSPHPQPVPAGKLVTDESEAHVLVVAPTGAGKGRNLMIPTLLTSHAPAVVIDVKGEAANVTARARREMGHDVRILDPFHIVTDKPDTLNPLDVVQRDDRHRHDDAFEVAEMIIGAEGSHRDRFWDNWSRLIISSMIEFVVDDEDEHASLGTVCDWLMNDDISYNLATLLDSQRIKGQSYNNIGGMLNLPDRETRPSVIGTVQQHLRLFTSPVARDAMGETSFDLNDLRDGKPLTIYLVIPPNKLASHSPLMRMWLWALMAAVINRDTNPPVPTLFIIDEMGHLGAMPILEQSITLMRGYGMRLMILLQNLGQIDKLYPNDYGTIPSNCLVTTTFGLTNHAVANAMAGLLGDMSAEQLIDMPSDALAYRLRQGPTRLLTRMDYLKDPYFEGLYDDNRRYTQPAKQGRTRNGNKPKKEVLKKTVKKVPAKRPAKRKPSQSE